MTEEQIRQIKLISYANWLVTEKFGAEKGIRDIKALTAAVTLPGNNPFLRSGERLSNRKDLYARFRLVCLLYDRRRAV